MAEAYLETKVEKIINLKLSEKEAKVLATILGRVGGTSRETAHKYKNSIADSLRSVGFDYIDYEKDKYLKCFAGCLYFTELSLIDLENGEW